jgi:hypothetical protein
MIVQVQCTNTDSTNCSLGQYCSANACVSKLTLDKTCSSDNQCISNQCNNIKKCSLSHYNTYCTTNTDCSSQKCISNKCAYNDYAWCGKEKNGITPVQTDCKNGCNPDTYICNKS